MAQDPIPGLIAQLHSLDYTERKAAAMRLVALGDAAVPALLTVALSAKVMARARATEALGQIGDRRAFWPLVEHDFADDDYDLFLLRLATLTAIVERQALAPTREDASWFIAVLTRFRSQIDGYPIAIAAAQGALTLARIEPCAELLPVLALLKGNFFSTLPPEFAAIRKELAPLLADWKYLPVVVEAPPKEALDLPRPAKEQL